MPVCLTLLYVFHDSLSPFPYLVLFLADCLPSCPFLGINYVAGDETLPGLKAVRCLFTHPEYDFLHLKFPVIYLTQALCSCSNVPFHEGILSDLYCVCVAAYV